MVDVRLKEGVATTKEVVKAGEIAQRKVGLEATTLLRGRSSSVEYGY